MGLNESKIEKVRDQERYIASQKLERQREEYEEKMEEIQDRERDCMEELNAARELMLENQKEASEEQEKQRALYAEEMREQRERTRREVEESRAKQMAEFQAQNKRVDEQNRKDLQEATEKVELKSQNEMQKRLNEQQRKAHDSERAQMEAHLEQLRIQEAESKNEQQQLRDQHMIQSEKERREYTAREERVLQEKAMMQRKFEEEAAQRDKMSREDQEKAHREYNEMMQAKDTAIDAIRQESTRRLDQLQALIIFDSKTGLFLKIAHDAKQTTLANDIRMLNDDRIRSEREHAQTVNELNEKRIIEQRDIYNRMIADREMQLAITDAANTQKYQVMFAATKNLNDIMVATQSEKTYDSLKEMIARIRDITGAIHEDNKNLQKEVAMNSNMGCRDKMTAVCDKMSDLVRLTVEFENAINRSTAISHANRENFTGATMLLKRDMGKFDEVSINALTIILGHKVPTTEQIEHYLSSFTQMRGKVNALPAFVDQQSVTATISASLKIFDTEQLRAESSKALPIAPAESMMTDDLQLTD